MAYNPQPIDTSAIALPADLGSLREQLARNVHDTWAQGRLHEGWVHGPQRDDDARTHPCLIPYEELPESEKDYDRRTAEQTLKAIMALGFRIVRE